MSSKREGKFIIWEWGAALHSLFVKEGWKDGDNDGMDYLC